MTDDSVVDYERGKGRIKTEYAYNALAAVHLWIPELEPKPPEGYLFNDAAVTCWVTWFSGMELEEAVDVYWMEFQTARSNEASQAYEKDPSKPLYDWEAERHRTVAVHAQTEDGVVHIFDITQVLTFETRVRRRVR